MTKRMLVDATHAEEVRVAVVQDQRLIDLDIETASREQIKGNIYLARVTRVEPSLQAAFVEFHGGRQGFLSINDIHGKYYPPEEPERDNKASAPESAPPAPENTPPENGESSKASPAEEDEISDELPPGDELRPRPRRRHIPIQRLLTRGQTLLVQVVKEARSNKGASLTTHISLAGRYTVLLPENSGGGGISRKITDSTERKHLKEVLASMEIPNHISLIIRTAGLGRTKREIARDMSYLLRLWKSIEEKSAQLKPPALIHEEGDLIIRAIRDLYTTDMEEILIDGQEGYRIGKDFMRLLMPRYVKVVQPYKDSLPLFARYQIENQIESMHERKVPLRAGGYLVIDPTEALVSIDINSGRSTRERDVESTAFKTNIQAAEEIARQLRMRDLGGLIVIDFIDMDDKKHIMEVEKHLKESLKQDRAKIQIGKISLFGLLELSRQRMKPTFNESNRLECPRCKGLGTIRSVESASIHLFRQLEEEVAKGRYSRLTYTTSLEMANYLLNNKREQIRNMEATHDTIILIYGDPSLQTPEFHKNRIERTPEEMEARQAIQARHVATTEEPEEPEEPIDDLDYPDDDPDEEEIGPGRRQEKRETVAASSDAAANMALPHAESESSEKSRRRRRRRKKPAGQNVNTVLAEPLELAESADGEQPPAEVEAARPKPAPRRSNPRHPRPNRNPDSQTANAATDSSADSLDKGGPEEAIRVTPVPGLYVLGSSNPVSPEGEAEEERASDNPEPASSRPEADGSSSNRSRRRRRRRRSSQARVQAVSNQSNLVEGGEDESAEEEMTEERALDDALTPETASAAAEETSEEMPPLATGAGGTQASDTPPFAAPMAVDTGMAPAAEMMADSSGMAPATEGMAVASATDAAAEGTGDATGVAAAAVELLPVVTTAPTDALTVDLSLPALPEQREAEPPSDTLATPEAAPQLEESRSAETGVAQEEAEAVLQTAGEPLQPATDAATESVPPVETESALGEAEPPAAAKGKSSSTARPRSSRSRTVKESPASSSPAEKKPRAPRKRSPKAAEQTSATATATPSSENTENGSQES
ncbi:MAG: Rne/Rng family ribonuclease [Magnetococcales bacterium]|nr:Rne/Rng family ribonuclease [Magnetococcales bacterium]